MRLAYHVIALLFLLLFEACTSVRAPLDREPGYPSTWPDIASLGEECADLAGWYSNHGTAIDPEGATRPVALTDILLEAPAPDVESISLEAVTKRPPGRGKDTFSRLRIGLEQMEPGGHELGDCFCIDQALFCPGLNASSSGEPGLGLIGGQQNVWLTRGADRTLLVRIESQTSGIVLVVPVHSRSRLWARFQQAPSTTTSRDGPQIP